MYSKENTDCGMLSLLNKLLIDNGISFIVSYNIHTLLMHAFYLIIVLNFLVMPKIIDLVGILEELLCLLYIA